MQAFACYANATHQPSLLGIVCCSQNCLQFARLFRSINFDFSILKNNPIIFVRKFKSIHMHHVGHVQSSTKFRRKIKSLHIYSESHCKLSFVAHKKRRKFHQRLWDRAHFRWFIGFDSIRLEIGCVFFSLVQLPFDWNLFARSKSTDVFIDMFEVSAHLKAEINDM